MSLATQPLIGAVRLYQYTVRPLIGATCRFTPSCSDYALQALRTHGAVRGTGLAAWRVLRCNPWCACGHDPVPPARARRKYPRAITRRHIPRKLPDGS
jgi:putative membrane protein insertion efficiency factor